MSFHRTTKNSLPYKTLTGVVTGLLTFAGGIASAGTLNIAQNALEIATGVEPNVMILNDDSGSMDWTLATPEADGAYVITSDELDLSFYYTHADGDNADTISYNDANENAFPDYYTLPTQYWFNTWVYALNDAGFEHSYGNWQGIWRTRNADYNKVYYNPDTTYKPWVGVDNSGAAFADMSPTAARVDPYLAGSATINLTSLLEYNAWFVIPASLIAPDPDPYLFAFTNYLYPASYYEWTDSDEDGIVDADDAYTLVWLRTTDILFITVGEDGSLTADRTAESVSRKGTRTDCGGDGEPTSSTTCTAAQELQNFANWYSYYRRRELTAKAALGNAIDPATSARVGMATINNNASNRIQVASMNVSPNSGNKKALLDKVYLTQSSGDTPLREQLEAVGQYFACGSDNIFGVSASSPGAGNCPVQADPAGTCQQNYTILMADGYWNGDDPAVSDADNDSSSDFDGGSFASEPDNTLADVAMHYYENDLHDTLTDSVPTTPFDRSRYTGDIDPFETMHQHMATYTIGFGVTGDIPANPTTVGDAFAWGDPYDNDAAKIDDLRHAAWNGRGAYLSANDLKSLTESLESVFDEIGSGTGAASSVAFNTQNLQSGALVFRAFFDTNTNTGNLVAQPVTISGEILSQISWSAAEQLDSKASESSDTRVIVTYDADNSAGIPFAWDSLNDTQKEHLNTPLVNGDSTLADPVAPDLLGEKRLKYLRGQTENEGTSLADGQFRERLSSEGKLGDIIHSSPVFVGLPFFSRRDTEPFPIGTGELYSDFRAAYQSRRELVYIGANDGMLHGFDANTGEEVFAYVPNILFPDLTKLADPDYNHRYYVDLTPSINDVYITPTSGTNSGDASWNTVLLGGLGGGGKGYYALNITNPTDLTTQGDVANNVMWEFTPADDVGETADGNDRNLGYTFSAPIIAMSNIPGAEGTGNRWVAIWGNGYNSESTDGDAELYIAFIDGGLDGTWTRGTDFVKINTGNGKEESADGTTPNGISNVRAVDVDQNGTVDVVYAGDLQGNLYRFNLTATTVAGLTSGTNLVQTLFTATYSGDGTVQPITARPIVVKHPTEDGFIVIVGTGSYFTVDDATSTDIQSLYGLWDDFATPSDDIVAIDSARLQEQVFTNVSSTVNGFTVRTLTNNSFRWGTSGQNKQGWFIDFDVPVAGGEEIEFPGERAVRRLLLRGGFLFVNTVIPKSSTACTVGPGGFELALDPIFGGSNTSPLFDTNNDGSFNDSDNVGGESGVDNVVSGLRFDESTPTDSSFIGNRKVTQTSDKEIRSTGTDTGTGGAIGRHSWREIDL